ncbi:uncharacterized protein LOC135483173 isoform X2 [Lineus longissimus]|uniref:uncharacterized protein LOC135483173 isoform X2 n=1 Tax=Lineus longissimus TaxID=88925 RepID=UPI002B4EDF07
MYHTPNFYNRVLEVISKPSTLRTDFEVLPLLPWFRKKSDIISPLNNEILLDVIKHCQFVSKKQHDVIIKQGEKGDCFYITLHGKVTIYIKYAKLTDVGDESYGEQAQHFVQPDIDDDVRRCSDRSKLGTFVCSLGPGDAFGEVALLSEDCIRTASIVVDEHTDLICIDRALYNRSVKSVLQEEFEDKANFIATNPFFSNWAPRYKKQLAMAFRKETYVYETVIAKQGEPVTDVYFILSGEVKVTVNPTMHHLQYPDLYEENAINKIKDSDLFPENNGRTKSEYQRTRLNSAAAHAQSRKSASGSKRQLDVCLLGKNEIIGDMEVLLDMDTFMQTAVCNQRTKALVLEMKHWERLLVRRNPQTVDQIKHAMALKAQSRMNPALENVVPLFKYVIKRGKELRDDRLSHAQRELRRARMESFTLPPRGALIDLFGPGTVFYRIRKREEAREKRSKAIQQVKETSSHSRFMPPVNSSSFVQGGDNKYRVTLSRVSERVTIGEDAFYDVETSDPVLSDLERRLSNWLGGEKPAKERVTKMHRYESVDPERQPKGGATVVLRPKSSTFPYKPVTPLEAVAVANVMSVDDRGQTNPTVVKQKGQ